MTIFLAACASVDRGPASRYFNLPAGSEVIVQVPITIPANSAHRVLQGGQPLDADGKVQRYRVACEIEVNEVRETPQIIVPDHFSVTRTIRRQELVQRPEPLRLAGVGVGVHLGGNSSRYTFGFGSLFGFDDDRIGFNTVTFVLQSARQPNVRELRCTAGWAFASQIEYPTLAEIHAALGSQITLRLPTRQLPIID